MMELNLGQCGVGTAAEAIEAAEEKSGKAKERAARRNINKYMLWCRLKMDPDQELSRMRDALEKMVEKAKESMLHDIEDDPELERHIKVNAKCILQLLEAALTATVEELFPGGVPADNQMKAGTGILRTARLKTSL